MSAYGSSAPCGSPRRARHVVRVAARAITRGRRVPREHLHLTLAFLGHRPVRELDQILEALRASAEPEPIRLLPERYRETRSVGMLVLTT